jgi:hypothetical protein
LSPAVARAGRDLATAQANVLKHVIVHRCEPPHVPPDAQFMAIAATCHPRLRDITVSIGLACREAALSVRPPCVLEGSEFAPDEIFAAAQHSVSRKIFIFLCRVPHRRELIAKETLPHNIGSALPSASVPKDMRGL